MILPIKKKWFDMIASGEKKEEYREVKPYYTTRFEKIFKEYPIGNNLATVIFRNGYSLKAPAIEAECMLRKGKGKPEWGAEPGVDYYILVILAIKMLILQGKWKTTDMEVIAWMPLPNPYVPDINIGNMTESEERNEYI